MDKPDTRILSTYDDYAEAVMDLLSHAKQQVNLFTPDLNSRIYDRPKMVDAVRSFATRNQHTQMRILIGNPNAMLTEGRRLLDIARRLSSHVAMRVVADDFVDRSDAFITADKSFFALRRQADTLDGLYDHSRPELARKLADEFNEIWEHSLPDPGFRQLHI